MSDLPIQVLDPDGNVAEIIDLVENRGLGVRLLFTKTGYAAQWLAEPPKDSDLERAAREWISQTAEKWSFLRIAT